MLYFITGNAGKFREISALIPDIQQLRLDLDEIQSLDPQVVIAHKLDQAARQHDGEFIVEDTSLIFACLKGLPGTQIKWFFETLGNEGIADLVNRYDDHSAIARATIGHRDQDGRITYFVGEVKGHVVPPRGDIEKFGWNPIFQPEGETRTFAEMTISEKNHLSMRGLAAMKLKHHLEQG
jgi:non-canonical purine NTP pyrophosphatase (RdgB/HAM1 family)